MHFFSMSSILPQTALVSVTDKSNLVSLAQALGKIDCRILASGGTAKVLQDAGIHVEEVSEYTGAPEMFNGRVKTIHPKIAGGILARRGQDDTEMQREGVSNIDLVVVNLYAFEEAVAGDISKEDAIEQIDIGGPSLIRAAAKNHRDVLVVVDPSDYGEVIGRLESNELDLEYRNSMSAKAFRHTAAYDTAIAEYFTSEQFPEKLTWSFRKQMALRYGENPHQEAAFYSTYPPETGTLSTVKQYSGKELSYNNLADTDAAVNCVKAFEEPACAIIKHGNPCGVAVARSIRDAYLAAFQCDPTSAFGGVISLNRELDEETASEIIGNQFVEVLVAPSIADAAIEVVKQRKNVRLLSIGSFSDGPESRLEFKRVSGGVLVQTSDRVQRELSDYEIATERQPGNQELSDLFFAWRVAMFVKSNAIVLAKNGATIGVGAGQMNRVLSARIAQIRAEEEDLLGGNVVLASDAFFPFRDSIDAAAKAGVTAVIQPGGSIRDREVIEAANEHDIAMILTSVRHFRH